MTDWTWNIVGILSGFASVSFASAALRSYAIIKALENIEEIDLLSVDPLSLTSTDRPVAISGEVVLYPGQSPLLSLNNEKCSIIEELVQVRTYYAHNTQDVERSRTYKEERFGLGQEGKLEPFVSIDRASVMSQLANKLSEKFRYSGSIRSILKPGGAVLVDNEKSVFDRVLQLLFGVVEGPILITQSVLGISTLLTVVGRLEVLSGGRWMISVDPSLGEFLFLPRRGLHRVLGLYKTSLIWQNLATLVLAVAFVRSLRLDSMLIEVLQLQLAKCRDSVELNLFETGANLKCVVCLERSAATVLVPCGHRALCNQCALSINGKCPICRSSVERFVRVFDS